MVWQYGEDAVKESGGPGGGGGGGMQDIFDMLSGQGRRGTRERRGENVVHRMKVSLEEVYNGATRCAPPLQVPIFDVISYLPHRGEDAAARAAWRLGHVCRRQYCCLC
jgi:hypothetical protein